jgi:hypothetical protein
MRFKRKKRSDSATWLLVAGVVLTGAAAAYAVSRLLKSGPVSRRLDLRGLEKRVIQALLDDPVARNQGIDIAAVGSGVVELSGSVGTEADSRHVVEIVDRVPGVHAVLNRIEISTVETRLQRNRAKAAASDGTRWYGGGVGMGRRRQGASTDPRQRDDHVALRTHAMQPNRDDTLTEVEESEQTNVRIGMTNAGPFNTHVAPPSPEPAT